MVSSKQLSGFTFCSEARSNHTATNWYNAPIQIKLILLVQSYSKCASGLILCRELKDLCWIRCCLLVLFKLLVIPKTHSHMLAGDIDHISHIWSPPHAHWQQCVSKESFPLQLARICRQRAHWDRGCLLTREVHGPSGIPLLVAAWLLCGGFLSKCCLNCRLISVWGPMHFLLEELAAACFGNICLKVDLRP